MKKTEEKGCFICPICGNKITEWFDLCDVCFWEYDPVQADDFTCGGGANHLCVNDYRKRWRKLEAVMPALIEKYSIAQSPTAFWKYDGLMIPRERIRAFVGELTDQSIAVEASFYNVCERYGYDSLDFHGYVWGKGETVREQNDEVLRVIFTSDPVQTCRQYRLVQLLEILEKSENVPVTWESLTPTLSVKPNPRSVEE